MRKCRRIAHSFPSTPSPTQPPPPLSNTALNPRLIVDLVDHPIDLSAYHAMMSDPDAGAVGWFHGVTRRTTGDQITETLYYEAHSAMAKKQLHQLATMAAAKFGLLAVVIVHRLGEVPIGQASILVGCLGGHRKEVFAALPWMMDDLKREVAIWKQETFVSGPTQWVHPDAPTDSSDSPY